MTFTSVMFMMVYDDIFRYVIRMTSLVIRVNMVKMKRLFVIMMFSFKNVKIKTVFLFFFNHSGPVINQVSDISLNGTGNGTS